MSAPAYATTEALEREVQALRQTLQDIISTGHTLIQALPVTKQIPGALAHGPLLTMVGLAEAGLASGGTTS